MISFGGAIEALKAGKRVMRGGWNGKGMWLSLVTAGSYDVACGMVGFAAGVQIKLLPWIGMRTADGSYVPWLASQTDMLADDWQVV